MFVFKILKYTFYDLDELVSKSVGIINNIQIIFE